MVQRNLKIVIMLSLSFQFYVQSMNQQYSEVPMTELGSDHNNATVHESIPVTQTSIIQPTSNAIHAQSIISAQPRTYTRLSCKDALLQTGASFQQDCNDCKHYCVTRECRESRDRHPQVVQCKEAIEYTTGVSCAVACLGQPFKACLYAGISTAVHGLSFFADSTEGRECLSRQRTNR